MSIKTEVPILAFASQELWQKWLEKYHATLDGVWVQFYKKNSGVATVSYAQAVETALCYGWIDSQVKKFDDKSYLQKFTPRRSKSIWSKVNTLHIERLMKEGKMKPAGVKQVAEAKKNGRWDAAYNSPSTSTLPEDFLKELSKNKKAKEFFETLTKTNTYAIAWRLETAKKPETRAKRMNIILAMLAKGEKFH